MPNEEKKPSKETLEILKLYDKGLNDKEIAKQLGVPVASVRARQAHRTMGRYDLTRADAPGVEAEIEKHGKFTWIPIYAELANKVLSYRNRQSELISILKDLEMKGFPVISIVDYDQQKITIPLAAIDPFTFFACFNTGIKNENRRGILAYLKAKFELQSGVPGDFDGIPILFIQNAWFFPYATEREPLWACFGSILNTTSRGMRITVVCSRGRASTRRSTICQRTCN
jgi:hypothetical protein